MWSIIKSLFFLVFIVLIVGCSSQILTGNIVDDLVCEETCDGFETVSMSEITETISKFDQDVDGVNVRYFVVRDEQDVVHTAFDACDVCGGSKGYSQVGEDVVCNKCGQHFKISDIGTKNEPGGCWPSLLEYSTEGEEIKISKDDIAEGKYLFG